MIVVSVLGMYFNTVTIGALSQLTCSEHVLSCLLWLAYFKTVSVTGDNSVICFLSCLRSFGIFITILLTCLLGFKIQTECSEEKLVSSHMAVV